MYVFLTISTHLKTYQTLFHELIAKALSHGRYIFTMPTALLMKGKILKVILMEGNSTHT